MQFEWTPAGSRLPEQELHESRDYGGVGCVGDFARPHTNFACDRDRSTDTEGWLPSTEVSERGQAELPSHSLLFRLVVVVKSQKWVIYSRQTQKLRWQGRHLQQQQQQNNSWTFEPFSPGSSHHKDMPLLNALCTGNEMEPETGHQLLPGAK